MVFDAAGSRKTPTREASCGVRDVPGVRGKPEDPHPGGLPARTFPKTRKTPHALKSMRGLIRQCPGLSVGQSPGDVPQQFPQLAVLPAQGFQLIAAAGGRGGHLLGEPAQPFPVAVQVVQRHDGR